MRTLQEKYNGVLEGKFSKTQFRRDAAMELPQFISSVNSFDDTVAILKNKGIVTEAKVQEPKYSTAKPEDQVAPDVLDTGIKFELDKKYGTLDVTPEQYEQCRAMAAKNLAKDLLYYVKQDSIQLDEPGEKMEKAKLKEEVAEAIQNIENDAYTIKRIAKLVNDLLQKYSDVPEIVAYAAQVKSNLEDGDPSTLKRYKSIMDEKDLIADLEAKTGFDLDNELDYETGWNSDDFSDLEENQIVDLPMTAAGYSRGETYDTEKYGKVKIIDQLDGDDIPAAYGRFRVEKINEDEEESPEDYANANAGSPMHAPPGLEEEDLSEPDVEDLYQHDQEYLDTLKKRKALKEMFKKIIVNLINE